MDTHFKVLWEAITDAVIVVDEHNSIHYANPALEAIFGHPPAQMIGRPLAILQPERFSQNNSQKMEAYAGGSTANLGWRSFESLGLHRDGQEFPLEISYTEIVVGGKRMFASFLRDISERVRLEARQAALLNISEAAHSSPDLAGLFVRIHEIIGELLPARNFYVALYDQASDILSFPYWVDEFDPCPEPFRLSERHVLTGRVIEMGEPLLLGPDWKNEKLSSEDLAIIGTDGVDWLGIPLKTGRGTIGVLTVQNYTGNQHYTEKDKELLQFVSDQVAFAVERKQAQQEMLDSERLFRTVFDQSPSIISLVSFPEGRVIEMNAAGLDAFGFSREEMTGITADKLDLLVDPAERERYLGLIQSAGMARNFEARVHRRDGGVMTLLYNGSMIRLGDRDYVLNSAQDISEREIAEAALRESEAQFKNAFEHSTIGMALVSLEGRFLTANPSLCSIVGYSREELQLRSFQEITHPDDIDLDLGHMEQLKSGETQSYEMKKRYFHKQGNVVSARQAVSMVSDKLGKPKHFVAQIEDITERQRAEHWQLHYADALEMIAGAAPIGTVLNSLARFAERESEGMKCSILLLSADGKRLLHGAAPSLPDFYNSLIDGTRIGPNVGSCGAAAATGELFIAENISTNPNWTAWSDLAERAGLRSCWSQPVFSSDQRVLGTFAVYRSEASVPTARDLELIRQSAGLAAIAIERERYLEDQRLAKVVFEQSEQGIMVTDAENRILMVNRAFQLLTGLSASDVVGQTPDILDGGHDDDSVRADRRDSLASSNRWSGEVWGKRRSGEVFPMTMSVAAIRDSVGATSHYISIISDVSDQKLQAARIEQLAFYDSLTGLPNRALFLDRLEQTLVSSKRHGGHGAILFLDLDRFKDINDTLGHAVGDLALAEVARRFQSTARKEETLARLGGDEFVLIAENADHQAAVRIAARLQRVLAEPLDLLGQHHIVGASIGIAFYPADGQTCEELIKRTDIAMYHAKSGGGGYRLYHSEMGVELEKRLAIAKRLELAMAAGELQLYYQPQIDLASGAIIGAEALLRWNDSRLGWISPGEFIPIAEERGMMGPLGDWVLAQACRQINAWAEAGLRLEGKIAINVSALQMEDPDLVGRLLEIVHSAGLNPGRFELELTESSMMVDPDRAVEVMELLRAAGFGLSIDDFGTGYSSLSYLKRFAAEQIKIDISFVRNMLTDADDHAIVTTIIAMARSLGLKTTAEGVEEAGQAAALLSLGCDFAQGYFFGRPEAPDAFRDKWLAPALPA